MRSDLFQQMANMGKPAQNPPLDLAKFKQMAPRLTKENLVQLVQQARAQGIPDEQIEQGLDFLLKLK